MTAPAEPNVTAAPGAPATTTTGTEPAQQGTTGTQPSTATQTTTQADPFAGWDGKVESLPEAAQKIIRDARKEAADHRAAKNAETERVQAILKAAGIDTGDEDPVKALEATRTELGEKGDALYDAQIKLAMVDACETAGTDRRLTTAVLALDGKLDDLDPTADDFKATLAALVAEAVKTDPKLKAVQAAAASGVSSTGGPGESADIDAQIEAATKAGNHALAISLKRQKTYAHRV